MQTLQLKADVSLQAAAEGQPPRVSIVAYTGGIMRLPGWGASLIDLAGLQLASIPLLADHDNHLGSVAGSGVPRVDGGQLFVEGTLADGVPAASQILALHKSGVQLQASVGVEMQAVEQVTAGKTVQANGRTHTAPAGGLNVTTKGILREVSFVAAGADSQTSVHIAASKRKAMNMTTDFSTWLKSNLPDVDVKDGNLLACCHANFEGRHGPKDEDYAAVAPLVIAAGGTMDPTELQIARAEKEVKLKEMRAKLEDSIPMAHTVRAPRDRAFDSKVMEAAFCQSAGLTDIEKHYDDRTLQAAHDQFHGQLGLQQAIIMAAVQNGYHYVPGQKVSMGNLEKLLAYALPQPGSDMMRATGFSTISLPNILSNVANKKILEGYMEEDPTWREISTTDTANDFKDHTSYRMLDNAEYEEVGAGGEIKHGTLGEEYYTRRIATYAKMFTITRTAIINDDAGAFNALRVRVGRGSAKKLVSVFWKKFINNSSFFTSGRGNYIEGSTTNLGTDYVGLQLGLNAFRDLRSPTADGAKRIGGQPVIVVVPPELETNAMRLYGPLAAAELADANPYTGKYRPVVVDQLSDSAYTGYSTTAWYLFRANTIAAPMVVSFLNGQQSPTVENAQPDFNVLGIALRGYHDFGCDFAEYLAGIKSKGAA